MVKEKLPPDWEVSSLRDVCKSITDGTHFTPKYTADGIPFYSVENLTANDFVNTKFISEKDHLEMIKRCKPEKGDILMTRIGSIGDTKLIDWDVNASIYVSLALLKVEENIDPNYLYAYSKSEQFVKEVESRSLMNASPKKINMGEISSVEVIFPKSRTEQEAIAKALSDVDELISDTEKLILKKQNLFEGMIESSFSLETGAVSTQIKELCRVEKGEATFYDKDSTNGNYGYLNGGIDFSGLTDDFNDDGDTVVVSEGGNSCGYVNYIAKPFWCGGHAYRLLGFSGFQKYLFYAMKAKESQIMNLRVGSGLPNVQKKNLEEFSINVHLNSQEQNDVTQALDALSDEIIELIKEKAKYELIKQGMMNDLLTGKVRLL